MFGANSVKIGSLVSRELKKHFFLVQGAQYISILCKEAGPQKEIKILIELLVFQKAPAWWTSGSIKYFSFIKL